MSNALANSPLHLFKPTSLIQSAVLVALLFAIIPRLSERLNHEDVAFVEPPVTRESAWSPTAFRFLTFGQMPSSVDFLLIRFLAEDPSYTAVAKGTHPPGYFDLDLATDLDAAFYELYSQGAQGLAVIRSDGIGAAHLLEKALRFQATDLKDRDQKFKDHFWPSLAQIPFEMAYVQLFELGDLKKAVDYFMMTAQDQNAPGYLEDLRDRLSKPGGIYRMAEHVIDQQIHNAKDPSVKDTLVAKRESLELQKWLYFLNLDFEAYRSKQKDKFRSFLQARGQPPIDPQGGALHLNDKGKIVTDTPLVSVLGLSQE